MNVYLFQWDGEDRVVEAPDFGAAVVAWRAHHLAEYGPGQGWDAEDNTQPDSVQCISREPVLR